MIAHMVDSWGEIAHERHELAPREQRHPAGEERFVTPFWYLIVTLGIITAIINFGLALARRQQRTVALVRALAGVVSLVPPAGIIVGKALSVQHPYLEKRDVIIGIFVFIFLVLVLPSYVDRGGEAAPKVTLQQRAARPANATVRMRNSGTDEWVN
jgi:hypothetical protein